MTLLPKEGDYTQREDRPMLLARIVSARLLDIIGKKENDTHEHPEYDPQEITTGDCFEHRQSKENYKNRRIAPKTELFHKNVFSTTLNEEST